MSCSKKPRPCSLTNLAFSIILSIPTMSHAEGVSVSFPDLNAATVNSVRGAPETMALVTDFAVVLQIDGDIGSIILGNAAIADAVVSDGRMIVLTGKHTGITNMIVLDASNQVLTRMTLHVSGRKPGTITVRRALQLESYACDDGLCSSTPIEEAAISTRSDLPPS